MNLADLAVGLCQSEAEIAALPRPHDLFEPHLSPEVRADLYGGWQQAVARTLFNPAT